MRRKIVAAMTALGLSASASSAESEDREAWIVVDRGNESVSLKVFAALEPGETGQFQLKSRKSGNSGSAVSQQSGSIRSGDGGVAGPFSTSRFSLRDGEKLEAELVVTTSTGRTITDTVFASAE